MKLNISRKLGLAFAIIICIYGILISTLAYGYLATKIVDDLMLANAETVNSVHDYYLSNRIKDIEKALFCWVSDPRLTSESDSLQSLNDNLKLMNAEWKNYAYMHQNISSIYFGSAGNGYLNGYPNSRVMPDYYDGRQRQWYQNALRNPGEVIWSAPYFDIGSKNTVVMTLSKAVIKNRRVIGVIGIDIKLSALSQMLGDINCNNQGTLVLLDKNQQIIAHPDPTFMAKRASNEPILASIAAAGSTQGKIVQVGQDYVYACKSMPMQGWTLVGYRPINTKELVFNVMILILVTTVMITFVLLHAGVFSSRIIVKPLKTLTVTIEAIRLGDQKARSNIKTHDEVGEIGRALDNMLDQLEIATAERMQSVNQMHAGYVATVRSLANAIEAKDPYTRGHCDRVSTYALALAKRLELSDEDIRNLEFASILHDVGKVGIPDGIIGKTSRLTDVEFAYIKEHPAIGADILNGVPFLENSRQILLQHHERIDGKGYPKNLVDKEILPCSKILAIADSYDAMTSNRPYREAPFTTKEALYEIERNKGTQFDTVLANHFISMMTTSSIDCNDERTRKCTS